MQYRDNGKGSSKKISNRLLRLAVPLLPMIAVITSTAQAHGGHGEENGTSILHYLVEPEHMVPAILAILLAASLLIVRHRKVQEVRQKEKNR